MSSQIETGGQRANGDSNRPAEVRTTIRVGVGCVSVIS